VAAGWRTGLRLAGFTPLMGDREVMGGRRIPKARTCRLGSELLRRMTGRPHCGVISWRDMALLPGVCRSTIPNRHRSDRRTGEGDRLLPTAPAPAQHLVRSAWRAAASRLASAAACLRLLGGPVSSLTILLTAQHYRYLPALSLLSHRSLPLSPANYAHLSSLS